MLNSRLYVHFKTFSSSNPFINHHEFSVHKCTLSPFESIPIQTVAFKNNSQGAIAPENSKYLVKQSDQNRCL